MERVARLAPIVALLGPALLVPAAPAKEPGDPSAAVIVLRRCEVEYEQNTLLVSPLPSVLQDRLVRRGDHVKAGQVLGRLFDQDVRAEVEMSAAEADSDIQVRITKAEYARSLARFSKTQTLSKRQFASPEEVDLDSLAVEKARLAIEEAEHRRRVARIHQRKAQAEVRVREFVSPHDGVVVDVPKNQGESVTIHEPVFRVVNDALLRVTGALNVADTWRVKEGQPVRIRPDIGGADLAVEREVFQGRVTFVDRRIDPESQTCRVMAEVKNRDNLLKAGLEVQMEIWPAEMAATSGAAGPPGPSR